MTSRPHHACRATLALALTALLTVLCAGCATASNRAKSVSPNQDAPDFVAKSLTGRAVSLSSLHGRVVILFLWAAWECFDELAELDDIASRWSQQPMSVVAVSIDRSGNTVEKIAKSRKRWALAFLHEPTAEVARRYNPRGFPAAYVIDANGTVRHTHYGVKRLHLHSIEAQARELLAEK